MNKTEKLIAYARKHPKGLRFTELQRFIVELNGLNYDQKEPIMRWDDNLRQRVKVGMRRQWRGYWSDRFSNTYRGPGILTRYFRKLPNGRYVVNSVMKAKPTQLAQLQRALKLLGEVHKLVDDAVCADLSVREEALLQKILRSANNLLAGYEDIL